MARTWFQSIGAPFGCCHDATSGPVAASADWISAPEPTESRASTSNDIAVARNPRLIKTNTRNHPLAVVEPTHHSSAEWRLGLSHPTRVRRRPGNRGLFEVDDRMIAEHQPGGPGPLPGRTTSTCLPRSESWMRWHARDPAALEHDRVLDLGVDQLAVGGDRRVRTDVRVDEHGSARR